MTNPWTLYFMGICTGVNIVVIIFSIIKIIAR